MTDTKQQIIEQLYNGVATVVFKKRDGTLREMNCTLSATLVPARQEDNQAQARKENPHVQSVWDVDKNAWRSFRWDSLVQGEDSETIHTIQPD